jgi:hypothetical protein
VACFSALVRFDDDFRRHEPDAIGGESGQEGGSKLLERADSGL